MRILGPVIEPPAHLATVLIAQFLHRGRVRFQAIGDERLGTPAILRDLRQYIEDGVVFQDKAFEAKLLSGEQIGLAELPPDLFIAGTPEDCIEKARMCQDVMGADYVIADFGRAAHGPEFERINEMFQLFGQQVLPAFR